MVTEATGFDFFLAHQGVVYGALARLGIHRGRSDFQDWRDEGMLVYLNYFNRYREPLVDETAIDNKLMTPSFAIPLCILSNITHKVTIPA